MSLQGLKVGDYQLQACIGSDGFVETYLASNSSTKQQATIKIIRTDLASSDAGLNTNTQRLLSEADALRQLNQPNILLRSEFGSLDFNNRTLSCIITPVRQEKNLIQWLQERSISRIAPKEVAHIVHQAVEALEYAHQPGILHPPITFENFILPDNPQNPHYPRLFLPCAPAFFAPEEWGRKHDPASDQHDLAVLAHALLTGRSPSESKTKLLIQQHPTAEPLPSSSFDSQLSQDFDFVFAHALAKIPEERFHSLSAFDYAFQSAASGDQANSGKLEMAPVQSEHSLTSKRPSPQDAPVTSLTRQTQQVRRPSQVDQRTSHQRISSPTGRWSLFTFLLIVLAGCIIIASAYIYYSAIYQPGQLNAQTTATALVPTLAARRMATAQAQATATFTSFQDSFDQLTADPPTVSDSMTDPSNPYWPTVSNSQGSCNFTTQGYNIIASQKSDFFKCFNGKDISNFVYQIQVQINQGISVLLFRFSKDHNKNRGYAFFLSSSDDHILNHNYALLVYTGPNSKGSPLMEGKTIPIVPGERYQVAIVARGNNFSFYLNGSYVNSTHDNAATSNSGIIGLGAATVCTNTAAASVCDNTADVVYTQLQVWLL
jgi:serine/threonine protein kinase